MRHELATVQPPFVRGPAEVTNMFLANLDRARAAAPHAPELLVPVTAHTLFVPTEPFMTQTHMKLPVGRQRMEVLHISDYRRTKEALRARGISGPLSQAFEPRLSRLLRRRLGIGHANNGGPWMLDEPALADVRKLISRPSSRPRPDRWRTTCARWPMTSCRKCWPGTTGSWMSGTTRTKSISG